LSGATGCLATTAGLTLSGFQSPSAPLSGQTRTAGQRAQPATIAMGQIFMGFPSWADSQKSWVN
jgi:hypothetical protein